MIRLFLKYSIGILWIVWSASIGAASLLVVSEEPYILYPRWEPRALVGVQFTDYTTSNGRNLIQAWTRATPDRYIGIYLRHSADNGKTWSISHPFQEAKALGDREDLRYGNHLLYLDEEHDLLVMAYWRKVYKEQAGGYVRDAVLAANATNRIYTQISRDGGISWEAPEQVIQEGDSFDELHWAEDVRVGYLSGMVAGCPHILKLSDGTLLMPFQVQSDPDDLDVWKQGVFRGKWRADLSGIDWSLGEYVENPGRDQSKRGIYVGTLAELGDGRIMMVMRGFVGRTEDGSPAFPGEIKWKVISEDKGKTWSKPEVLTYSDGSPLWTSSSNSRLFRSAHSGKLYLIAHVREMPLLGSPRRPLAIMEIAEDSAAVIKESVTILRDKAEGDTEGTRWEIRGIYEDRDTGNLVMYSQGFSKPGTIEVYRYEVADN